MLLMTQTAVFLTWILAFFKSPKRTDRFCANLCSFVVKQTTRVETEISCVKSTVLVYIDLIKLNYVHDKRHVDCNALLSVLSSETSTYSLGSRSKQFISPQTLFLSLSEISLKSHLILGVTMGGSPSKEKRTKPPTTSKYKKKAKVKGKSVKVKKSSLQWSRTDGEGGELTFVPGRRRSSGDTGDLNPPPQRGRSRSLRFGDFTQLGRVHKVDDTDMLPVDIAFFQEGKVRGQGV